MLEGITNALESSAVFVLYTNLTKKDIDIWELISLDVGSVKDECNDGIPAGGANVS